MEPTAAATVIGALKASSAVRRWVCQARSAGAEIWRPRKEAWTGQQQRPMLDSHEFAAASDIPSLRGRTIELDMFERIDNSFGRATGEEALVVLASRAQSGDSYEAIAGLSGDELVMLLSAADAAALTGSQHSDDSAAEQTDGAGSAWVALVSLAGRLRNATVIGPGAGWPGAAARTERNRSVHGNCQQAVHPAFAVSAIASERRPGSPAGALGRRPSR